MLPLPRIAPLPLRRIREPFDHDAWLFELKHDGFRAMAYVERGEVRLLSRTRHQFSQFDALRRHLAAEIGVQDAIVDGEIVVLDDHGRSIFDSLMQRTGHACFAAFDLPWLNGEDLRDLPLIERKRRLRKIIPKRSGCVLYVDHAERHGLGLFELTQAADLEGIVAKPKASPYREQRKPLWVKIKNPSYSQKEGRYEQFEAYRIRPQLPRASAVGTLEGGGTTAMPRETIKNRAGTLYARRDSEGQFSEVVEKGRSLAADRRTKAKTIAKKGEGDRGDQKPRSKKVGAKKRAPAKKK